MLSVFPRPFSFHSRHYRGPGHVGLAHCAGAWRQAHGHYPCQRLHHGDNNSPGHCIWQLPGEPSCFLQGEERSTSCAAAAAAASCGMLTEDSLSCCNQVMQSISKWCCLSDMCRVVRFCFTGHTSINNTDTRGIDNGECIHKARGGSKLDWPDCSPGDSAWPCVTTAPR